MAKKRKAARKVQAESYKHPTADSPLRPDVGTQDVRWKYGVPPKGNADFAWVERDQLKNGASANVEPTHQRKTAPCHD